MVELIIIAFMIALNYYCDLGIARILLPLACWYIGAYGLWEDEDENSISN